MISKRSHGMDEPPIAKADDLNPTAGDYSLMGVKVLASVVPFVGGPITELLDLITPPIEKRKDAVLLALAQDVQLLKEQGVDVEELFQNESFSMTLRLLTTKVLRLHFLGPIQLLQQSLCT